MAQDTYVFPFTLPADVPSKYRAQRYRHGLPHVTVVERACIQIAEAINVAFELATISMDTRNGDWEENQISTNEAIDHVVSSSNNLKALIAEQEAAGLVTYTFPKILEDAISALLPYREE